MDNGANNYRRFLDGDDGGFVEIIKEYKDGLIFYINSFVYNIHIAEELAEDTFVKIITRKPKYSEKSGFKTWLYTIGKNVAIDHLRKNSKNRSVPIDKCSGVASDEESLELAYLRELRKITLHKTLKKLKPEYHQVLWLIYFEGFSNKQAAAVMGKSAHSVETLVYRARKALKSELEKEGFDYEEL